MNKDEVFQKVKKIITAYKNGNLGDTTMPEDCHPEFEKSLEQKLRFFTLPMALNYQRDSFKLWRAATDTYLDNSTNDAFEIGNIKSIGEEKLRLKLLKHRLALQPNKHINTWYRVSETVSNNWGTFKNLILDYCKSDFLVLQKVVRGDYKKEFPYLSGPKIFNYWSYILTQYCDIDLLHSDKIGIAPDTHVIQSSVKLGLITKGESNVLSRDEIAERWRNLLDGTNLRPIDVHSPLWFWSRNKFKYNIS